MAGMTGPAYCRGPMSVPPVRHSKSQHASGTETVILAAVEQVGILRRSGRILFRTVHAFASDNIIRLGAALAFYTTVAIAPLFVLTIAMAGAVFGETDACSHVIGEIERLAGAQASAAVAAVHSPVAGSGLVATLIGAGTLIFGTLAVFNQLQDALNAIWRVPPQAMKCWGISSRAGCSPSPPSLSPGFSCSCRSLPVRC